MYEIDIMPPPRKGGTITHKDCRLVLLLTKKKKIITQKEHEVM